MLDKVNAVSLMRANTEVVEEKKRSINYGTVLVLNLVALALQRLDCSRSAVVFHSVSDNILSAQAANYMYKTSYN